MNCTHPIDARRIEMSWKNKEIPSGFLYCDACHARWEEGRDPSTLTLNELRIAEGLRRAKLIAKHFGLEVSGYGYAGHRHGNEDASFIQRLPNGKERHLRCDGDTVEMLVEYIESKT